jgi:hypothetical protein
MTRLREMLSSSAVAMEAIRDHLDGLDPQARLTEAMSLRGSHQKRLFDAAAGFRTVTLDHFVSPSREPMSEVVHRGRNTLPMFSHFAKVFARPDDGTPDQLWGYNRNPGFIETTVGPGYFVAHPHDVQGEVLIDYVMQPPRHPDGWPEIIPNSARISRFVYYQTQDVMRGVSSHVTIGRATKKGKNMSAWFVLCRVD